VTTQKNGASALGLQQILGLKKYETAWTMLHKLRRAMVRPGRDLLTGRIEVDEGYVGGVRQIPSIARSRQHEPLTEFVCKNAEPTSFKRIDKLGRPPAIQKIEDRIDLVGNAPKLRIASLISSRLIRRSDQGRL
jgi:hypothetical protein